MRLILVISIITQVIIEILLISLVENCDISCRNHLARGDYCGALIFKMAAKRFFDVSEDKVDTTKENAIPKGTAA